MTLKELRKAIADAEGNDRVLSSLKKRIDSGKGDYRIATEYAERLGAVLARIYGKNFGGLDSIPLDDANALIAPTLRDAYKLVATESGTVQSAINRKAGVSIRGIIADVDEDRVKHTVEKLASAPLIKTGFLLEESALANFARSAVTATIERNAEFQEEAGLQSYIERDTGGGCCAWCESLAGRYVYGEQPDDFFQVHKDCTCTITFQPAKRAWKRISYTTDSNGRIGKVTSNT